MGMTLSNLLSSALKRIGQMNTTLATGGSTTTLIDTLVDPDNVPDDDSFRLGFAVVLRDAGGASAAPEGEFSQITAYSSTTQTWTVSPAFSTAVAAGDTFAYSNPQFRLQDMIQLANEALRSLGDMPFVDTTTLTTAGAQTEYAASVAWTRTPPLRIDIQGKTGDTNDNRWVANQDWQYVPGAAGATGLIVFTRQPMEGRSIRVWYLDKHPVVNAYSDPINSLVNPEVMIRALILQIRNWQVESDDGSDQSLQAKWNKAKQELAEARQEWPMWKPDRKSKLVILRDVPYRTDEGFYITDLR